MFRFDLLTRSKLSHTHNAYARASTCVRSCDTPFSDRHQHGRACCLIEDSHIYIYSSFSYCRAEEVTSPNKYEFADGTLIQMVSPVVDEGPVMVVHSWVNTRYAESVREVKA